MVHECVVTIFNILTLIIKDVQHNGTLELSVVMLSVILLSVAFSYCYYECHHRKYRSAMKLTIRMVGSGNVCQNEKIKPKIVCEYYTRYYL
jgi:hypothetical protein